MDKCEQCDSSHDGKFGSGRFCNSSCSASYSVQKMQKKDYQKISRKLRKVETVVCEECGNNFDNWQIIKGKERRLHNRKTCLQCRPFGKEKYQHLYRGKGKNTKKRCADCMKFLLLKNFYHYDNGRVRNYCKSCESIRVKNIKRSIKQELVDMKGGKCQSCSYDKYIGSLEFHHVDKNKKDFNISKLSKKITKKVLREIKKCVLVCSNCHREIHGGIIPSPAL